MRHHSTFIVIAQPKNIAFKFGALLAVIGSITYNLLYRHKFCILYVFIFEKSSF